MDEKYEIVKFEQGDLILDINVSPNGETVWLTKDDMARLFGRDRSVITRHISKVMVEEELDPNRVCAKNARTGPDGKRYIVDYYNLDVVISVGYRVKSRNGVIFRRWANSVLKEYLLKGYVLNPDRTLITNDNYMELVHRVNSMDNRLSKLESDHPIGDENLFFDGQWFDARSFIKNIFASAKEEIILIDPYADIKALDFLKIKASCVKVQLFGSSKSKLTQDDVDAFNKQYGNLVYKMDDGFHDRFIIIDEKNLYHLGASLNGIGKKAFAITKLEEENLLVSIKRKLGAK
ncbi:MAG: virulence RhuM family protein [Bacilli bacterium]|nr:virulence RhuM family protein [Bacilli bacterium]